jgi:eukaryotic translation initiation factor 2C
MLRSSGITISAQFTQVEGRVLSAPRVNTKPSLPLFPFPCYIYIWTSDELGVGFFLLIYAAGTLSFLQLKVGNGEDFFPRNGRWNFNNKVLFKLCFSLIIHV